MNLVIVESPHKAETIQKFLGKDFVVKSSTGHIRDLHDKKLSIDTSNGFKPEYVIPAAKKHVVEDLKKAAKKADMVWLASDEDREGESISWHLMETLALDPAKTRRITFHEITKPAILSAIENPRDIDMNLVNAQQARRVLDRLVGFELSPVLWRKVQKGLSAGRVQSVALRLIVDREKEIMGFVPQEYYKVDAQFKLGSCLLKGTLESRFPSADEARRFLEDSIGAGYAVKAVDKKDGIRNPAAPFTTSTLQQEASRKLHFSVSTTMRIAQALYERGLITYMRTDSTNLSTLAIGEAKKYICSEYGDGYLHVRQYKTKVKGAQEAHEAIRPTFISNPSIEGTAQEQKLYELIWKRTVASQMSEAKVLATEVRVGSDRRSEIYLIQSTEVVFDGFLKLYMEGTDDEAVEEDGAITLAPALSVGDRLEALTVKAEAKFTQPPFRYSEATLVKKLEELQIGRPSTYATIISTLTTSRGYVVKGDKPGEKRKVCDFVLEGNSISEARREEAIGAEKGKLLPQDIGMVVADYLVNSFSDILDYDFTANTEKQFDEIAGGNTTWGKVISDFYSPFHGKVEVTMKEGAYANVRKELGVDPATGETLVARLGQFGPYVQKGDPAKKQYAPLAKGQLIETLTLEEALRLFDLPRTVGVLDGVEVIALKGRFGPYLKVGDRNVSLPRGTDPLTVSLEQCAEIIASEKQKPAIGPLKEFESGISIVNGKYGPYLKFEGSNYKLPRGTEVSALDEAACREIIENSKPTQKHGRAPYRRNR